MYEIFKVSTRSLCVNSPSSHRCISFCYNFYRKLRQNQSKFQFKMSAIKAYPYDTSIFSIGTFILPSNRQYSENIEKRLSLH